MKSIDNIIIISDYDNFCDLTVWFNGLDYGNDVEKIRHLYIIDENITAIMAKYHKDILLCCNGNIEYFEYKGEITNVPN